MRPIYWIGISVVMWLAIFAVMREAWPQSQPCVSADDREHIRDLMLDGLDAALKQQTQQLFAVLMKDRTGQPSRAIAGMQPAITAYINGRGLALRWSPPDC